MQKFAYFFLVLMMDLFLSACSPIDSIHPFDQQQAAILIQHRMVRKPTQQMIAITLPRQQYWKKMTIVTKNNFATTSMFIPASENLSDWHECIQTKISSFLYQPRFTINQWLAMERNVAEKNCQQNQMKILKQTLHYVIYQLEKSHCRIKQNQIQFGKIFRGEDALYLVRYSALMGEVPAMQIKKMSRVIMQAGLVRRSRSRGF